MKKSHNGPRALFASLAKQITLKMPFITKRSVSLVAGFALVGSLVVFLSSAATLTTSVESENGVKTGNVGIDDDAGASGGKYIRFGQQAYQELFVSTTGNDSKDGKSQANAVKTINKAVQLANGHTRIRIMSGRYLQTVQIQKSNLIIEPFGNGDVDIVGAIPEYVNGVGNWEYVQHGIYKHNLGRSDNVPGGSNTIYNGNGDQWWSYNTIFSLLSRNTKNSLPGVKIENQWLTGFSEVYVATDDNQPPDAPLYIGGGWSTIDLLNVDNVSIQSVANSKLKLSYGNSNVSIRNSSRINIENTEIIGGNYGIYAIDSSHLNFKDNRMKGKFGRTWTYTDVKNYPASMENAAIIVRATVKDISNVNTEGNTITGYWAGIYYQTFDNMLDPNYPNKYFNRNSVIADNTLYDNGVGLETEAYLENLIVKGNVVYDAGETYSPAPVRGGPVYVYENLFYADRTGYDVLGEAETKPGGAIKLNNDHVAPVENLHVYHNTLMYTGVDTNAMKTVHSTENPLVLTKNVSFTNNIFYSMQGNLIRGTGRAQDQIEFDGNLFYSPVASPKRYFSWNSFYDQNGTAHNFSSLASIISAGKMPSQWQGNAEGNPAFNCIDPANASCFKPTASMSTPSNKQPIPSNFPESARLNSRTRLGARE